MFIRILAASSLILFAFLSHAQSSISCCKTEATQDFALLSNDSEFVDQHIEPNAIDGFVPRGEDISFATEKGSDGTGYLLASDEKTDRWLFVVHEWWGLNDHIRQEAEALQDSLGIINVLCLDLYDGSSATTRKDASELMSNASDVRIREVIKGALAYAGKDAQIAFVGWCFGGGWSLQAALMAGDNAAACVMYYGMPEKNLAELKRLKAPVLGIFASEDKWITPSVVEDFEINMLEALKTLETVTFDADHAFANPSNPQFNEEASAQAFRLSSKFISSHWRK